MTSIGRQVGLSPEMVPLRWSDFAPMVPWGENEQGRIDDAGGKRPKLAKMQGSKKK
jgi:hypothetical protein